VVDYLGLADQLRHALATYTESGGKGDAVHDPKEAIAVMLEKHVSPATCCTPGLGKWITGKPAEKLALLPAGQERILGQEDGKQRFVQV